MKEENNRVFISHRGNIDGKIESRENSPDYIEEAIKLGYQVEIDVWLVNGSWYLGHDKPEYSIRYEYLKNDFLWCHAKNLEALSSMIKDSKIHCFWHQEDDVTLTSRNYIWTYPGKELKEKSICVMPEKSNIKPGSNKLEGCVGICSDIIKTYREKNGISKN